jgi:ribosomal protein S18 acetylase RimI-like enzyme
MVFMYTLPPMTPQTNLTIRPAESADRTFILSLSERFVDFDLPPWRPHDETAAGIHRDIERHLRDRPETSHFFVAEIEDGARAGFLHLQSTIDFFTGAPNCHVSDVAVAPGLDGRGIGQRLLVFAETFAKSRGCRFMTLSVFPGNERARALYERQGYGVELLRMTKALG